MNLNLLSMGTIQALYAINPPIILNSPVYIHFRFVYKIRRSPKITPRISHAPDNFRRNSNEIVNFFT